MHCAPCQSDNPAPTYLSSIIYLRSIIFNLLVNSSSHGSTKIDYPESKGRSEGS
ncbi:unnamed protein product [Penicillium roqueforti FM164]|uniref:Genomic scaffold, ProqFM164S01 n=1 Tax=Penicillium roqueforti (strain FM164) TaxID=1365484 RepID=W6QGT5_PENRF|nr:unnamed protein product [Penicillium roqueforti FM164]